MSTKQRDRKLVDGYIREQTMHIPTEIIAMIFVWYHLELYFYKIPECQTLNEDKTIVEQSFDDDQHRWRGNYNTSYLSVTMPSINHNLIYEYTIKILKHGSGVAVGIDDAECRWIDTWFIGKMETKNYGMQCWNGTKSCTYSMHGTEYGAACHEQNGVIIKMIYNVSKTSLAFIVDGTDYGIAYDDVYNEEGLEYRLAIYMNGNASVELIDFVTSCDD